MAAEIELVNMQTKTKVWGVLTLIVLMGLGWLAYAQWQEMRQVKYVIPAGVEAGQTSVEFPDEIVLTVGIRDTIVIENQDEATHAFGPFVVAPHTTLTKRFRNPLVYEGACTFHQDQFMKLVVNPAPWSMTGLSAK